MRPLKAIITLGALLTALLSSVVSADSPPIGDGAFQVLVEDTRGRDGIGVFGAVTGPEHPLGDGIDVLGSEGGTDAFSSYVTIRSYSSGTDYVQISDLPASGNFALGLEQFGQVQAVDGGYETTYTVPANDPLDITTGIVAANIVGESAIRVYGQITNRSPDPVVVGTRVLLDIALAGDDGPSITSGGGTVSQESEAAAPIAFTAGGQSLFVSGEGADSVRLAHWNRAFESSFDFEPSGVDVTSTGGLNDAALLLYFGADEASARTLLPEETFEFAVTISTGELAEICDNGEDDDGDGQIDEADPDCATSPTPSPTITPSPAQTTPRGGSSATPTSTAAGGPSSFPNTGGPFGLGEGAWWVMGAAGLIGVAGGAVFVARGRAS
jgi:hypothetical protein